MNRLLISCAALAVLAGGASAATVEARYRSAQSMFTGNFDIRYNNGVDPQYNPSNVGAGALAHEFRNTAGNLFAGQTLMTFCIDIAQTVDGNWRDYNITSVATAPDQDLPQGHVIGSTRAGYLASLYANAIADGLLDHRGSAIGFTDATHAAAFQLVVWELAYEAENTAWDLASGQFSVANSIAGDISAYFPTFFDWADDGLTLGGLRAMTFEGAQDQLIVIPLPTGGVMALAGLVGIAGVRRRR
jgi:hypothetical protein